MHVHFSNVHNKNQIMALVIQLLYFWFTTRSNLESTQKEFLLRIKKGNK